MSEPSFPGARIDVRDLLRIDVDAELRKVTRGQLLGPWQAPTELVRRAIAAGARHVDVHFSRGQVECIDDGAPIDEATMENLARLLDRDATHAVRHAGLAGLEAANEHALLCMAGLDAKRLEVVSTQGSAETRLTSESHQTIVQRGAPPNGPNNVVRLTARDCAGARARAVLEQNCGFARATIRVNGVELVSPFASAWFTAPIQEPLPGELAIMGQGETARAWLLIHGVVTTHVHITPAPPFDAAIEMGAQADSGTSAADLRALLEPRLRELVGQGLAYLSSLARRSSGLPLPLRIRVTEILLQTALRHDALTSVETLPMFPLANGHGGLGWYDLAHLRQLAATRGHRLDAVDPTAPVEPLDENCLLLSERARQLLSELARIRLEAPRNKDYRGGWATRARAWAWRTGASVSLGLRRLIGRAPQAVPRGTLLAPERALLDALMQEQRGASRLSIEMCEGAGEVVGDRQRVWLPRRSAPVRRAVQLYAQEPRWLYPIAIALLADHGQITASSRQRWQQIDRHVESH
ncbi:MAG: hypothetical protein B7733_23925 [Myxococcales bacterium FL481]|nr:MAG: hypothetical protein B7733_23925 [Myxococcales bacterium FL481]